MLEKLAGRDRRSIGLADEVAREIACDQAKFSEVFAAISYPDPVIRMRAADAVEKASRTHPERLIPHKDALLSSIAAIEQQEVRWHVALMLPRLPLSPAEKRRAAEIAEEYLRDPSAIVRVNALEALASLARGDAELEEKARRRLMAALESGRPSEKARARKLLGRFGR